MVPTRRSLSRDRLLGVGLLTRLVAAAAVLVLACGGVPAHRSIAALGDAYRWTGEAEAATLARGFAQSLSSRDLHDLDRIRTRAARLSGAHPDLTDIAVLAPTPGTPREGRYTQAPGEGRLLTPLLDGRGRPVAVLRLRFSLDERAEALAAGRREVLLAGVGAAILLIIGVGAFGAWLLVRPVERLSRAAIALAAGKPGRALDVRRRDAIGALAGSLDAI